MSEETLSTTLSNLLFKKQLKPTELARLTNVPQPTIQRMVSGASTRPHLNSLQPIADFFSISVKQLKGQEPIDWLDSSADKLIKKGIKEVPILEWNMVMSWCDGNKSDENLPITITTAAVSAHSFAILVKDASMEPNFPVGCLVIFDPEKNFKDRSYVLAGIAEQAEPIFRQLIIDADHKFVKALSPNLQEFPLRLLEENDKIFGTMIQATIQYND